MSNPENTYETPSYPADKEDVKKLQNKVMLLSIFLIIIAIIALAAVGLAAYALTKDNDGDSTSTGAITSTQITSGGSACSNVNCENGGSCFNIANNYICVCVATFYGRKCEKGKYFFTMVEPALYFKSWVTFRSDCLRFLIGRTYK